MKIKLFHHLFWFACFAYTATAQVQVQPGAAPNLPPSLPPPPGLPPALPPSLEQAFPAPVPPSPAQNEEGESVDLPSFSPLTDPEELMLIEGLDEPMERLRLRDQDTNMILDMIQMITNRHILRPQNLPAVKITFDSMSVLSKRETLLAVESLLAMNGIGITKIDDKFYKAVPASGMNIHVPIWLDVPASTLRPSQRIYMKMFTLDYAPALEVREQLNAFATPNVGSLLVFEKSNSILITDSLLNLQRMEEVIKQVDKPVHTQILSSATWQMMGEVIRQEENDRNVSNFSSNSYEDDDKFSTEFYVFKALNGDVLTLKKNLDSMIEKSLKPFLGGNTIIEVNDRTNQIYVIANKANMRILKFWLYQLDKEIQINTQSKLYKLQHADAVDVHRILVEVIQQQLKVSEEIKETKSTRLSDRVLNNNQGTQITPTAVQGTELQIRRGSRALGENQSVDFSPMVSLSVAERSNSILAYGMPTDIVLLDGMIGELDEPLPLARIDTIFVMVDLTEKRQRGIDALFSNLEWSDDSRIESQEITSPGPDGIPGNADDTTQTINSELGNKVLDGVFKVPGLSSAIPFQMQNWKLKKIQWDQIFSVASERNDVRIFSTPSIMVSHNAESVHIKIEDERNVVIPTYYGNLNNTSDSTNTGQRDSITASTELEIKKPKIGLSTIDPETNLSLPGSIFMEVTVKAEKFDETQSNVYQGQNLPGRKRREAMSTISIMDGEILVLGGLQEVKMDSSETRFNFLSDIPVLGEKFFRPKSLQYTPTELLIFLRPTIIDPKAKKSALTARKEDLTQAQSRFNESSNRQLDSLLEPKYSPTFKAPSGRVLGVPDLDDRYSSPQDIQSFKPSLE
jgi:general secretion pathway protein D